jgi:hypothetical protein
VDDIFAGTSHGSNGLLSSLFDANIISANLLNIAIRQRNRSHPLPLILSVAAGLAFV